MRHKIIFLFFVAWPLFSVWLSFSLPLNAFLSPIIFFGIPSLILSIFRFRYVKKSLFVSTLMLPFALISDYIAERTHTWVWPLPHSIFPFEIFSYIPIESVIWAFLQIYFIVIFFQVFFGKATLKKFITKRTNMAIFGALFTFIAFSIAVIFLPNLLNIPYWYLVFGCILLVPLFLEEMRYPKVFSHIIRVLLYFFYVNFSYEITALKLKWWSFPITQYIGHVSFFGVTFPFEEFFFWITLSAIVVLSYYEYFFNNEQ